VDVAVARNKKQGFDGRRGSQFGGSSKRIGGQFGYIPTVQKIAMF